jgi:tetratricopeptide (TPR) repeat protein
MLSYADAYHIYGEFDEHHSQKGVCMANIGSIMMQMGDYKKAGLYYTNAINNMNNLIHGAFVNDLEKSDSKV